MHLDAIFLVLQVQGLGDLSSQDVLIKEMLLPRDDVIINPLAECLKGYVKVFTIQSGRPTLKQERSLCCQHVPH